MSFILNITTTSVRSFHITQTYRIIYILIDKYWRASSTSTLCCHSNSSCLYMMLRSIFFWYFIHSCFILSLYEERIWIICKKQKNRAVSTNFWDSVYIYSFSLLRGIISLWFTISTNFKVTCHNSFHRIHHCHIVQYKSLSCKILPCHKLGQCQPGL